MQTFSHKPVLVKELLSLFESKLPQKILDCTFGRGGHSLAFLNQYPKSSVLALDRDSQALAFAQSLKEIKLDRFKVLHQNFHDFPLTRESTETYDLILMDLGPSSPQLDNKERGFSFNKDGPLDMRMDIRKTFKAEDIINSYSKKELNELFKNYGEIRSPFKVVNHILHQRKKKRIQSTMELASIIQQYERSYPHKHAATTWFLALRMEVNQELEGLNQCLAPYLNLLNPEALFAVISFHSLEDRLVKHQFRDFTKTGQGSLYNKKVIRVQKEEWQSNPRSRSAKLRVFKKSIVSDQALST